MNKKDMRHICHKAVELWGESLQTVVCMEEMAELMQSLSKNIRGMCDKSHIAEEIADVEIMLEQLKQIFHVRGDVEDYREKKLERLEQRIEEAKERESHENQEEYDSQYLSADEQRLEGFSSSHRAADGDLCGGTD